MKPHKPENRKCDRGLSARRNLPRKSQKIALAFGYPAEERAFERMKKLKAGQKYIAFTGRAKKIGVLHTFEKYCIPPKLQKELGKNLHVRQEDIIAIYREKNEPATMNKETGQIRKIASPEYDWEDSLLYYDNFFVEVQMTAKQTKILMVTLSPNAVEAIKNFLRHS